MARGKHTTLGKALDRKVRTLEAHEDVRKVVLGPYENCRHRYSPGTVRCKREIDAGLHCSGYDGRGVVELYVYTDAPERVREYIERL